MKTPVVLFPSALAAAIAVTFACAAPDHGITAPSSRSFAKRDIVGGGTCPANSQTAVLNGSFEAPVLGGGWTARPYEETSWHSSFGDLIEIWSSAMAVTPAEGVQLAELNYTGAGSIWQDICVPAGSSLSYSVSHRGRSGTEQARLAIIDLGANAVLDDTDVELVGRDLTADPSAWVTTSGVGVISSGNPLRFRLTTISPGGAAGNLIDNVIFGLPAGPVLEAGALPGAAKPDPFVNVVRNGQTVPLAFRFVNGGQVVTDPEAVELSVESLDCAGSPALRDRKQRDRPGVHYDADKQGFVYNWRVPLRPGACYAVEATSAGAGNHVKWKFRLR